MRSSALVLAALVATAGALVVSKEPKPAAVEVPMQQRLEALGPVLDKLKSLDPKTFGTLSGMLSKVEPEKGTSFLQFMRDEPDDVVQARLAKLGPILAKLQGLDPKSFGALSQVVSQVQPNSKAVSLLQAAPAAEAESLDPAAQQKLEALAPVLSKLKGLDPKAFGMLNNLMASAEAAKK